MGQGQEIGVSLKLVLKKCELVIKGTGVLILEIGWSLSTSWCFPKSISWSWL